MSGAGSGGRGQGGRSAFQGAPQSSVHPRPQQHPSDGQAEEDVVRSLGEGVQVTQDLS